MQTAEQAIVERIKLSRSTTEPEQSAPTENTEAVNVSEDAPVEEVIETEAQVDEEVTTETEESEATENSQDENSDEESDLLYYDIDNEEVSIDQIKEWKSGSMMQADYTRKTTIHSEDVKAFNVKEEAFDKKVLAFEGKIETLQAMISEEALSDDDLKELREYEPEKYIEYTEKMVKRKQFVDKNKSTKKESSFDVTAEHKKLWDANPTWLDNGKQTKVFTADMKLIQDYATNNSFSNDDFSNFKANDFQMMLKASKYDALNNKNAAIEKKVRKAPVMTKPRATANGIQTDLDAAIKAFKKNPTDKNAVALRKLKRQINN